MQAHWSLEGIAGVLRSQPAIEYAGRKGAIAPLEAIAAAVEGADRCARDAFELIEAANAYRRLDK